MPVSKQSFVARLAGLDQLAKRLCIGVDPHAGTLQQWGLSDSPAGVSEFSASMLRAAKESGVTLMKPQVALFERHGLAGLSVLAEWLGAAREKGIAVIADVKRGDIGTSLRGYADAWLTPGADFEADAMTLSAYLGVGSLQPAIEKAAEHGKGLFVLAATSNPEGRELQAARLEDGRSVSELIVSELAALAQDSELPPGALGVVIGATVSDASLERQVRSVPWLSLLQPGYGFQGVALGQANRGIGSGHRFLIPTVSRSVAGSDQEGVADRLAHALEEVSRAV